MWATPKTPSPYRSGSHEHLLHWLLLALWALALAFVILYWTTSAESKPLSSEPHGYSKQVEPLSNNYPWYSESSAISQREWITQNAVKEKDITKPNEEAIWVR